VALDLGQGRQAADAGVEARQVAAFLREEDPEGRHVVRIQPHRDQARVVRPRPALAGEPAVEGRQPGLGAPGLDVGDPHRLEGVALGAALGLDVGAARIGRRERRLPPRTIRRNSARSRSPRSRSAMSFAASAGGRDTIQRARPASSTATANDSLNVESSFA
jgi:hypothetical protein